MRRALKWIGRIVLLLIAIPILAVAIVLAVANLDFGRRLIENQTASLTGGIVRIQGLAGRFPDALRADRIEVSDAQGPYVTVSGLTLDWSPSMLLEGVAQVDHLQADQVDFARLPVSESKTTGSGGSFTLPVRVDLQQLSVPKATIGAAVVGTAATLALAGSGQLRTLTEGTVHLTANRLDGGGLYHVDGDVTPQTISAAVTANEPANGLIAAIAKLPALGAIGLQASVNGPRDSLATQLGLSAGPLKASASGTIDLEHEAADLAVHAQAPAMQPAPDIGWQSILLDATVRGPFSKPDANGTVRVQALTGGGARIGGLAADVKGNAGQVQLHATVTDLHVPGPQPDILAAAPVVLDVSAKLEAADRPVTFALRHPLITLSGTAQTEGRQTVQAHLDLPDLAPLAHAGGTDIQGHTSLDLNATHDGDTTTAAVKGAIAVTGGMAPVPALIGDAGRLDLAASMHGQDITLSRLTVNGKTLDVTADGSLSGSALDLNWAAALSDLAAVQADLSGKLDAKGHAGGQTDNLAVQADIGADLAAKGYQSGHIAAHVDATGLPDAPKAAVTADGTLLDAPLSLALTADRTGGVIHADIAKASWKSLQALGTVSLAPQATLPTGQIHLSFTRLADLQPLLGRPIAGAAEATLDADDQTAHLSVDIKDASLPGTAAIGRANLKVQLADLGGNPTVDGSLIADGVSAGSTKAVSARLTAKGPLDAIGMAVDANAPALAGNPAQLVTTGTVNARDRTLALTRMEASWKQQVLRLLAPAKLNFANGVAVDRLRLGFRQAELIVSGSAGSTLDLTASLRNLQADVAAIASPSLAADGVIAADLRLTGTSARPQGHIKLTADRVRLRQGPGQALPAANLATDVTLLGTSARIDSRLTVGPSYLTVTGAAPLLATSGLNLQTDGRVDLAMLNPLLSAQGRKARGEVTLKAAITGTTAAPRVTGAAELRNGDLVDYALGAHVGDLAAEIQATGDTIRLTNFSGKAGQGTLGGSGTISLAGQMPVDLHFTADNARPLSSDLLTARIDANLSVQGEVKGDLQAGGTLHVRRADIRIPDKLPASIAVLPVRIAGAPLPPPPPVAPPSSIALSLTIDAPQQVFIRGRGLDAELGGTIHIKGTATEPIPDGGLKLRRGTLSVIGTTLNFTEGSIDFSGAGLSNPSLHFVATSTTSTITATLTVSGSAKDPKITLSSVPDEPQDEILSQLLFNTSTSKLSPLQLAQIATALASLSGATGSFDPLDALRTTFGLDRLSVGSDTSGNPQVQAGRYVARGVYLGAKQSTSGGAPQATVQVDLAKGLKLETTAGSSSNSATGSTGSADAASVGLTYQFEY
jgi:translocation and assembly module TamB